MQCQIDKPVQTGWLIELKGTSEGNGLTGFKLAHYWLGPKGWTRDSIKAFRFGREEDAKSMIELLLSYNVGAYVHKNWIATEHIWQ